MPYIKSDKYCLTIGCSNGTDPADSTTYYFGQGAWNTGLTTTSNDRSQIIPTAGTIRICAVEVDNAGATFGSTENCPIYIRLNDTTDYLIGNLVFGNIHTQLVNSNMNIPVSAGNTIQAKVITPAWATNPTSVRWHICVIIACGA